MKKRLYSKKMALNRETLKKLEGSQIQNVAGGTGSDTTTTGLGYSCRGTTCVSQCEKCTL
jgi:hypothetical protein